MRRALLFLVVALLLTAAPAVADSVVVIKQSDRYVSVAPETEVLASPAAVVRSQGSPLQIAVGATPADPAGFYGVQLQPATGDVLAAGRVYDNAIDHAGREGHPGLSVSGDGQSCRGGRFEIFDVAYGPDETIERLWAVYSCRGSWNEYFGEVRVGYGDEAVVPALARWPLGERSRPAVPVPITFRASAASSVAGVVLTGADAAQFAIVADDCTGRALPAGATCVVAVRPRQATAGTQRAGLRFTLAGGVTRTSALESFAYGGETGLSLTSEAGDPVGAGAPYAGTADRDFVFYGSRDAIVAWSRVGAVAWDVAMVAPAGDVLAPGLYAPARPSGLAGTQDPVLGATRQEDSASRSCPADFTDSSYTVEDLRFWPSGAPRSFLGTFVQRCAGAAGALRGRLAFRHGDTTAPPPWVDEAPASSGPATHSAALFGDPDAYVGRGATASWSAVDAYGDAESVYVTTEGLRLEARAPAGQPLTRGVYVDAERRAGSDGTRPELRIAYNALETSASGRFEILDIARAPDGSLERLWLVYEHRSTPPYGQGGAVVGEVRFGMEPASLTPVRMRFAETDAGRPSRAVPLTFHAPRALRVDTVALTGPGAGSFEMRADECSGRDLAAGERCRVYVRFVADRPGVATANLAVTPATGAPFTSALEAFAWGGTTRLTLRGEAGEPVFGAGSASWTPADGHFLASSTPSAVALDFSSDHDDWWLRAAAPAGSDFSPPATFANPIGWTATGSAARFGFTCTTPAAGTSFTVEELRLFATGRTRSAAISFVQRCGSAAGALHGSLVFRQGDATEPAPWIVPAAAPAPTPTATPSPAASPTPAPSPAASPTPTPSSTAAPSPSPSPSPSVSPTAAPSPATVPSPAGPAPLTSEPADPPAEPAATPPPAKLGPAQLLPPTLRGRVVVARARCLTGCRLRARIRGVGFTLSRSTERADAGPLRLRDRLHPQLLGGPLRVRLALTTLGGDPLAGGRWRLRAPRP